MSCQGYESPHGHIECEPEEISLIIMPNARGREDAVMIAFQNAAIAQDTVPGPRRHRILADIAKIPEVHFSRFRHLPILRQTLHRSVCKVTGQHIAKDIVRYKDGHQPGQFVHECIGFE